MGVEVEVDELAVHVHLLDVRRAGELGERRAAARARQSEPEGEQRRAVGGLPAEEDLGVPDVDS